MTDFSHLNKLAVTADSRQEYILDELEGAPSLILRPANESNHGYLNAVLEETGEVRGSRKKKRKKVNAESLTEQREQDRETYPEHVIVDWKGVVDSKGKPVQFSAKAAAEFVAALPNWIFDGIRTFAAVPENFIKTIDSEAKAGN